MKRTLFVFSTLCLLLMATSSMAQQTYGWTISGSSVDPFMNTADVAGFGTTYLWFNCGDDFMAASTEDGMASAEFDVVATGGMSVAAFTPMNGFLNAGGADALLLAVGGCPMGPVLAGSWVTLGMTPGNLCLAPSAANGLIVTVNCAGAPEAFPMEWVGLALNGGDACGDGDGLCMGPVSVEEQSWGSVKALYQ